MRDIGEIWSDWKIDSFIGEGSFGKVYKISREEFGRKYESALKVIKIPQSQAELNSVRNEGMSEDSVTEYFKSMVEDITSEFGLMAQLRGNSNIVSYEDHRVVELEDEFGWEIFIRMEMLTPLYEYLKDHPLTIRDVIRLGIEICNALELCQKYNIIHRDIKPENIFYSEQGHFKLGDFGIARELEKTSGGMSKVGTKTYMAPEVFKGMPYNSTVDIYSLGIVLYRFLNNSRTPFLPPYPETIRYSDKEKADHLRMSGAEMQVPCNATGRLSEIVLKACAYEPKDRYESASDMRKALESIAYTSEEARIIYPTGDGLGNVEKSQTNSGEIDDKTVDIFETPEQRAAREREEENRKRLEAEARARKEAEEKAAREREERERKEAEERAKREAEEERQRLEAEERARREAEERERQEEEKERKRKEAEEKARKAEEERQRKEQEKKEKQEAKALEAKKKEESRLRKAEEKQRIKVEKKKQREANGKSLKKRPLFWVIVSAALVALCVIPIGYKYYHHQVPDVTGKEAKEAQVVLSDSGLKYNESERVFSDKISRGSIVSQTPKVGEAVKKGTTINLTISKGAAIPAPDLSGKTEKQARDITKKVKLNLKVKSEEFSDNIGKGKIISQEPKEKADCEETQTMYVVLSKGIEQVKVPDVEGKTQKEAEKAVKEAKLKPVVDEQYSSSVDSGKVISQSEAPGDKIDKNSEIVIVVSLGMAPVRTKKSGSSRGSSGRSNSSGGSGEDYEPF